MDGEKKRPVLKSAAELKGGKALSKKKRAPKWPLLAALVLLAAGCWAVVNHTGLLRKAEDPQATAAPSTKVTLIGKEVKDFDQATVSGSVISPSYTIKSQIEYDAEGKEVEKAEGAARYLVVGDPAFKLNELLVDRLLQSATSIVAQSIVAQDVVDLSVYGLQTPALVVSAVYKDGTKARLNFGDKLPTGTGYYMSMDSQRTVYAATTTPYTDFNHQLAELHVVALPIAMDPAKAQRLLIEQPGKQTIELVHRDAAEVEAMNTLWLRQPYDIEAHMTRASALIEDAAAIALRGYAGHAETPEQLAQYGLDAPSAHILYEQEGESGKEVLDFKLGGAADELYRYCTIDESGDVYTVDAGLVSFLQDAVPAQLVDQFAGLVNIKNVDSVTVAGGAQPHVLSIERESAAKEDGTEEVTEHYQVDGQPAEEKPFKALYQEIIGLTFDKFRPEGDKIAPSAAPLASVSFKLNNGQPDRVIEYVPYDEDYCLIKDGEKSMFLIKRQKVQAMLDQCAAFGLQE